MSLAYFPSEDEAAQLQANARQEARLLRTKLEAAERKLKQLTNIDQRTGVLNREGLEQALRCELERSRRHGSCVVACLVACANLAQISTTFGHGLGDLLLRLLAEKLSAGLRRVDVIGRVGEADFLLLLPHTRLAEAELVSERLRLEVQRTALVQTSPPVAVELRLGVAALPLDTCSLGEVLTYTRLASGHGASESLSGLVANLVRGVGLRVVAQPIVELSGQGWAGCELLSRGPAGPFASPVRFLGLARGQDCLTAVDLACLRSCLEKARTMPPDLKVHVNIFPSTLLGLPIRACEDLFEGFAPGRLYLELSEEQFVGDPFELLERVQTLRGLGVRLAIDDVGKGRGTLDSVLLLEPDMVKIDRDLVDRAASDFRKERLLRRMLALTNAVGCEVVAEGVEREEDAALLRALGVHHAQGYLWSRPLPCDEFCARLQVGPAPRGYRSLLAS